MKAVLAAILLTGQATIAVGQDGHQRHNSYVRLSSFAHIAGILTACDGNGRALSVSSLSYSVGKFLLNSGPYGAATVNDAAREAIRREMMAEYFDRASGTCSFRSDETKAMARIALAKLYMMLESRAAAWKL